MSRTPPATVIDHRFCECDNCESGLHAPEDSVAAWEALLAFHYGDITELRNNTGAPFLTYMDFIHCPVVRSLPEDCQPNPVVARIFDEPNSVLVSYRDSQNRVHLLTLTDCNNPASVRLFLSE